LTPSTLTQATLHRIGENADAMRKKRIEEPA
jgi:hypothetical protein